LIKNCCNEYSTIGEVINLSQLNQNTSLSSFIDLTGIDLNEVYFNNHVSNNVFATFGCSWSRAWGSDSTEKHTRTPGYVENIDFVKNKSFSALVANHLNFDTRINFAIPGSNNDTQTRLMIEFVEKNRDKFDKVFILWGVTSIYRWELYCERIQAEWSYMWGKKVDPDEKKELEHYFRNHWDQHWQRLLLSQKIVTLSAYLSAKKIDHLFFPVFQPCTQHNMPDVNLPSTFYQPHLYSNDMMNLMLEHLGVDGFEGFLASPTIKDERISALVKENFLSERWEHPTEKGHKFIADRLISFLKDRQLEKQTIQPTLSKMI